MIYNLPLYFSVSDAKTKAGLERIINVLEERNVYDASLISGLRAAMKIDSPVITKVKKSESRSEKSKRKLVEKKIKSIGKLLLHLQYVLKINVERLILVWILNISFYF